MKLPRILNKAVDHLTEYSRRMCGFTNNKGKGVNKLFAPYDISEASIRHQLVSFGKEPLYSDRPTPLIIEKTTTLSAERIFRISR